MAAPGWAPYQIRESHALAALQGILAIQRDNDDAKTLEIYKCSWQAHLAHIYPARSIRRRPMRTAKVNRDTVETQISVTINVDGTGQYDNQTGVGFFDHMLDQLSRHSLIDMEIRAKGDLHIDDHHTVEDTGIALGQALREALGDKRGIRRYGACHLTHGRRSSSGSVGSFGSPLSDLEC